MNVSLGKIVGVFGVRGWVKVYSETRPKQQIFNYSPWTLELNGTSTEVKVLEGRVQGKGLVVSIEGYKDCDVAAQLINAEISVPQEALPATGKNEYYWSQLIGLKVENTRQIDFGEVTSLFETGANDVLVVKGDRERLIPFTEFAVLEIDLQNSKLIVDWDEDF